jgi:hypothetical protein
MSCRTSFDPEEEKEEDDTIDSEERVRVRGK